MCVLWVSACSNISSLRYGKPIVRPATGGPQNSCESRDWLHFANSRTEAVGSTSDGHWRTFVTTRDSGISIFRGPAIHPERLPSILPRLDDPPPLVEHLDEIDRIDRLSLLGQLMELGGYGVAGASAIPLINMDFDNPSAGHITAASLLFAGGLALVIWGSYVEPSAGEKSRNNVARVSMGLNDMKKVGPALDRANLKTRQQCRGYN